MKIKDAIARSNAAAQAINNFLKKADASTAISELELEAHPHGVAIVEALENIAAQVERYHA